MSGEKDYQAILNQSTAADGKAWLESQDPDKEWRVTRTRECPGAQYYKHIAGDTARVTFGATAGWIDHGHYMAPPWLEFLVGTALQKRDPEGYKLFTTTDLLAILATYSERHYALPPYNQTNYDAGGF